ncbi:hypothetical protein Fcan01_10462 [Folsomia candida]|uniref:Uncharacterized protein n=1 Tax=Folsomia candida TaxID=158441 RepID=A0A226EA46_FOLCA|nr:hypothetical protein Fcan01_10462 [Folsomia candida]
MGVRRHRFEPLRWPCGRKTIYFRFSSVSHGFGSLLRVSGSGSGSGSASDTKFKNPKLSGSGSGPKNVMSKFRVRVGFGYGLRTRNPNQTFLDRYHKTILEKLLNYMFFSGCNTEYKFSPCLKIKNIFGISGSGFGFEPPVRVRVRVPANGYGFFGFGLASGFGSVVPGSGSGFGFARTRPVRNTTVFHRQVGYLYSSGLDDRWGKKAELYHPLTLQFKNKDANYKRNFARAMADRKEDTIFHESDPVSFESVKSVFILCAGVLMVSWISILAECRGTIGNLVKTVEQFFL